MVMVMTMIPTSTTKQADIGHHNLADLRLNGWSHAGTMTGIQDGIASDNNEATGLYLAKPLQSNVRSYAVVV